MSIVPLLSGFTSHGDDAGQASVVLLVSFLLTFICARMYTRLARLRGWRSASIAGVHTHHMVFGVIIGFLAGAVEFSLPPKNNLVHLLLAGLFGCGAALVLDEFALAVHLQDVYWEKEGRKSVDAVVIAALLFFLLTLHAVPLGNAANLPPAVLLLIGLLNLVLALTSALKGKVFVAIFGVYIPVLAAVGAIRLAEPGSIWARRIYGAKSPKMRAAVNRYKTYSATWQPQKERLWDILGGKTGRPERRND